jgi:hypothetical protein
MTVFFSRRAYRNGSIAMGLAVLYLPFPLMFIVGAAMDLQAAGTADGSFLFGLALITTLPFSLPVTLAYSAIETTRGVPVAQHDGGPWTLAAFALCALLNALLIWVTIRGRRIRVTERYQGWTEGTG